MKITQNGMYQRIAAATLCGLSLLACHEAHATGMNGFRPNDTNVIAPGSHQAVTAWKQVGFCGNSAIQISPSWVLAAHHSHCSAGNKFGRTEADQPVFELVDADYATPAMVAADLHLSHLAHPLPYQGDFTPLVDRFYNAGQPLVEDPSAARDGYLRDTDVLLVGYGVDEYGLHDLKAGWAPSCCVGGYGTRAISPSNPHFAGFAGATSGDSGGGVFVINRAFPQGVLAGVMQMGAPGLLATKGFATGVREDITAIMADVQKNPTNEQVTWVSANEAKGELVRLEAPDMTDDTLVSSSSPGTLRVRIPQPLLNQQSLDVAGYRVRLLREDHLNSSPTSFDFSRTLMPWNRDMTIGSGIGPGTWYLTVTAFTASDEVATDPDTGERTIVRKEQAESHAAKRVKFVIPANNARPQQLKALDVVVEAMDLGDGKPHWCATISAQLGDGPKPEGILWSAPKQTWRMPVDEFGGVCDTWDETGTRTVFPITAYPYIGAAIGPGTTVNVVGPKAP